jgi:hypothetical protein
MPTPATIRPLAIPGHVFFLLGSITPPLCGVIKLYVKNQGQENKYVQLHVQQIKLF